MIKKSKTVQHRHEEFERQRVCVGNQDKLPKLVHVKFGMGKINQKNASEIPGKNY